MKEENKLPNLIKAIIIILSLGGSMYGFFWGSIGDMFLSSSVSWESSVFMVTSILMPFLFGAFLSGIIIVISALFKKKINDKVKIYLYSTFVFAWLNVFNAVARSVDYSRKSLLVIVFIIAFIWFLEKTIKDKKKEEVK